jgi:endonuclease/exonuclease/phosphatase family metal-dependent hydrolase
MGERTTPLLPRLSVIAIAGLLALGVARGSSCDLGRGLRAGTFNIRCFGVEPTDMDRLTAIVEETDSDVLAIQEVQSEKAAQDLARRLSKGTRRYAFTQSSCGGRSLMHLGFLYDTTRVTLVKTSEYPELDPAGEGSCSAGERPGLAGLFQRDEKRFYLLAVHLAAGGEREKMERRRVQWKRAHQIAAGLRKDAPVAILGDTNSTGFLDDKGGERTFIEDEAKKNALDVSTRDLRCSEYFAPSTAKQLIPSLLDHVVVSPELVKKRSVHVHGYCEELACAPTKDKPNDYVKVSDHCPVTFDLTR